MNRREFAAGTGGAVGGILAGGASGAERSVRLVSDPADPIAGASPARWALDRLREALVARGIAVRLCAQPDDVPRGMLCIVAAGAAAPVAGEILGSGTVSMPDAPEALALARGMIRRRPMIVATGRDARGLAYALPRACGPGRTCARAARGPGAFADGGREAGERHPERHPAIRQPRGGQVVV